MPDPQHASQFLWSNKQEAYYVKGIQKEKHHW